MKATFSVNHSRWDGTYHVVWVPKYRKKILYDKIKYNLGKVFHELACQKECKILDTTNLALLTLIFCGVQQQNTNPCPLSRVDPLHYFQTSVLVSPMLAAMNTGSLPAFF